jgi:hypothetical protein
MKLIFVYNANSGAVSAILDSAHKLLSPTTYDCKLCDLTHGVFSENKHWSTFKESSSIEMVFLHKDEFLKQYKSKWLPKYNFPVILSEEDQALHIFMSSKDFETIETVVELIAVIESKV